MAVQKRSISFDESVLAEAERLSAERGGNLSAFVNDAVEQKLKVALGKKLIEEDIKKLGPIPDEISARIEAEWPD
jgi:metal-responsive CopG/Arc/MetJ family transcriptional regulator